jgi:probable DNA repair protein
MADIGESPFHISEARLLIDQPIVASALLLLNLLCPRIDQADVGAILRSPFIRGAHAEQNERALADIALRKQRELDFNFRDIERVSRSSPILSACFHSMAKLLPKTSQRRPLSDWSEFVSEVLLALGWPGERELTPSEDSLAERWKDQLSELSSLGLVSAPVSFESALAHLRRLLSVPLESGDMLSPIQVLDASLAGGVEFDSAFAVGLSEETWPPLSRISPLVPLKLQRHSQVPINSADERARRTHAIFESSPDLFVTFSDRLTSLAQPFIARKGREIPIWQGLLPIDSFKPETLDQQRDGQAPVFVAQGNVRGGTGVIKAQSQCPFQAFAKYRLHARRPEDASFGFDALDRGSFVHKSLEFVWKRLQSLQNLRQMPTAELKELVRESIEEAVTTKEAGPLHQLSVVTERERLQEVILDWLEVERVRDQDFVVETIEEEQTFEVPGLSLTVRLDRIDRLRNGNLVLIDYKSGKQTRPKLAGERPAEPQLLVYAASVGSPVDGVFFGQLKPRDVKAVGYSRVKHFKDRTAEVKKDWNDYIDASRENVQKLAVEFVSGVAEVRPHNSPCEYCGMKPFCRVNEKGVGQEDEE